MTQPKALNLRTELKVSFELINQQRGRLSPGYQNNKKKKSDEFYGFTINLFLLQIFFQARI